MSQGILRLLASGLVLGFLSVLSPCVAPLLPIYASALRRGRFLKRLLGIAAGTFTLAIMVGYSVVAASVLLGAATYFRVLLAALLIAYAASLLAGGRLEAALASVVSRLSSLIGEGTSGFALGLYLAILWWPCTLPFMLSAFGLALPSRETAPLLALSFSAGFIAALACLGLILRSILRRYRLGGRQARYLGSAILMACAILCLLV